MKYKMAVGETAIVLIAVAGTFIVTTLVLMACILHKKMKKIKYGLSGRANSHVVNQRQHASDEYDADIEVNMAILPQVSPPPVFLRAAEHHYLCASENDIDATFTQEAAFPLATIASMDLRTDDLVSNNSDGDASSTHCLLDANPTYSRFVLSRMKKSHSVGCYAAVSSCTAEAPYSRYPEDLIQEGISYNLDDTMLHEGAMCNSYTKLKIVYDIQAESLRRTNSSPPMRGGRSKNNNNIISNVAMATTTSFFNNNLGNGADPVHCVDMPPQEIMDDGYDRAKGLYDRICSNMSTLAIPSDSTAEQTPTPV